MIGPGSKLEMILAGYGIYPSKDCPCIGYMRQMNEWGVEGCKENREVIIQWLRDGYSTWGWKAVLKHAAGIIARGGLFKLSWPDPFPGLVDEAIRQSQVEQGRMKKQDQIDQMVAS